MDSYGAMFFLFLSLVLAQPSSCFSSQVYIVYAGRANSDDPYDILKQNHQMLTAVHEGSIEEAQASHVYSYSNGFRGFAAKLTEKQASEMAEMPGVVSVFPNTKRSLHTTHSWDFLGLSTDESTEIPGFSTRNQENVIIGFIDTVWQEYGQNQQVSVIMECLRCLRDGKDCAKEEKIHPPISLVTS